MKKIIVLNGPNLNMLGFREPEIYGTQTFDEIKASCLEKAKELGVEIDFRQTNHEGILVDWIQEARGKFQGLIINAAAYTHSSIAIHDALKMLNIPIIEVHLSDPAKREDFRKRSFIEPLAQSVIKGHGAKGYLMALEKMATL